MATTVQILTTNYSGQTATITFSPCSGGTINLGSHVVPYNYVSDNYLGDYSLYFTDFSQTCTFSIPCATATPTPTVIVATATPTPAPATSTPLPTETPTETPIPATSTPLPTETPTETPVPAPATPTPAPTTYTIDYDFQQGAQSGDFSITVNGNTPVYVTSNSSGQITVPIGAAIGVSVGAGANSPLIAQAGLVIYDAGTKIATTISCLSHARATMK